MSNYLKAKPSEKGTNSLYSSELVPIRWPLGPTCLRCNSPRWVSNSYGPNSKAYPAHRLPQWHCSKCAYAFTVISGTRLDGCLNLGAYVEGVKVLCKDPIISGPKLAEALGTTFPTAYRIIKEITEVMTEIIGDNLRLFSGKELEKALKKNKDLEKKVFQKLLEKASDGGEIVKRMYATKGFSLDVDLIQALEKRAHEEGRSLSNLVNRLLRQDLGLPPEDYAELKFGPPAEEATP